MLMSLLMHVMLRHESGERVMHVMMDMGMVRMMGKVHRLMLKQSIGVLLLQLPPLGLVPPVLEPDLHLCLCQFESMSQVTPFRSRQVLLMTEPPLQFEHLGVGEGSATAFLFLLHGDHAVDLHLHAVVSRIPDLTV